MFKRVIRGGLLLTLLLLVGTSELRAQSSVSFLPNGSLTGVTSTGTSTVFSNPILLPDGTADAPALAFSGGPTYGLYRYSTSYLSASTALLGIIVRPASSAGVGILTTGVQLGSTAALSFTSNTPFSTADTTLVRDAANTLALRNGTAAQTFNIYNTYTDASNYERGALYWNSNVLTLASQALGTGGARNIRIDSSNDNIILDTITADASDGRDIGSAVLWRNLYLSRSIQGSKSKSLTDAGAAVSIWRIAVPTNGYAGGKVIFTANSTDGTDRLTTTGEVTFAGADTAGTVTCGIGTPYGLVTAYRRANTLLCTFTAVTSTTNCDIQVTCTDNKAGTQTMAIESRLDMPAPNTVTPQ